jgi:hypothetical protein
MKRTVILIITVAIISYLKLSANEISFTNGKITYTTPGDNAYYNGKIEYGDFTIPYKGMNKTTNGSITKYEFGVQTSVSDILDNADLLSGSTGTVWTENNKIIKITLDHAIFGKKGAEGVPLVCSAVLSEDDIQQLDNGYFNIADKFTINIPKGDMPELAEDWGDTGGLFSSAYYYHKRYSNEFSLDVGFLNLKPTASIDAGLDISPTKVHGNGRLELTLFDEPITFSGVTFPKFLLKDNPYYLEGEFEYNDIYKMFSIRVKKGAESGNIEVSGEKSLKVILDPGSFGLKLNYDIEVDYELADLVKLLNKPGVTMANATEYLPSDTPIDEVIFVWVLQHFKTKDEILAINKDDGKLDVDLKFSAQIGFDPDEIVKMGDPKYCEWNLLNVDIDFNGEKKQISQ